MLKAFKNLSLAIVLLDVSGCGVNAQADRARSATMEFRNHLLHNSTAEAYGMSGPEFKESISLQNFGQYMVRVRQDLGEFESGQELNYSVGTGTRGIAITLVYRARYSKGSAIETIKWQLENDRLELAALDISPESTRDSSPGSQGLPAR